jgi:hypothetical protein
MPHDHARNLRWDQATPILASQILPGFLKLSASSYAAEEGMLLSDLLARAEESKGCVVQGGTAF